MENVAQLISEYLDGELDDAGIERLAAALRSDATSVDQLVINSFVHCQLDHWMNVRQIRDDILSDVFGDGDASACEAVASDRPEIDRAIDERATSLLPTKPSRRNWVGTSAALAAMLLIAATLSTAVYLFVSRPKIVAQLTQATDCRWLAPNDDLPVGSWLRAGQNLRLESGRALLTFSNGARMLLAGPSTVTLDSASEVDLQQGHVAAQVPTPAIGFTVSTPSADFVDLGTEFKLQLEDSNSYELQVFDGLVEVQFAERGDDGQKQRLQISEGSAIRYDAAGRDVTSIPYDEKQRDHFD